STGEGEAVSAVDAVRPVGDLLETDEARGLLEAAQQTGSVNAEEIALALDELDLDAAQIDDFYHALDELHIDVVGDGEDPAAEKLNKIVRSERKLRAERGREPSSREIGRDLDLGADEVEQIRRSAQTPVSLEKPVGDEEESEFGHFLTDETEPLPDEAAEVTMRKETLRAILGSLAPRERRVLELRYGLDGQHPRTLDEVGRTFNVTRERIRQIENQSLKKLRALADAQRLREVAA